MKAAVVEEPGRLAVRELSQPELPGDYGVVCELLYGATCAGTDRHLIAGDPPFCYWLKPPFILGHESIGRVIKTGSKVRNFSQGDLITRVGAPAVDECDRGWGGFAEYGVALDWQAMREHGLPQEQWQGARVNQILPSDTDSAAATMIITWRETLSYVKRMGVEAEGTLLVIGSGANGLCFMNHAKNLDTAYCAMIGSSARENTARIVGADAFVDYKGDDAKEQVAAVCPEGFDFVIDAVGKAGTADLGLSLLKPDGTIGIYGLDDFNQLRLNPMASNGTFTVNRNNYDEAETHELVVEFMRQGRLDAANFIDLRNPFELEEINQAFDAIEQRRMVKALVKLK